MRTQWHALKGDASAVAEIEARGWWPERPPFRETRALDLENGAGEDFLYMHRKMILMLKDVYAKAGASPPAGWTALPAAAVPQTIYNEATVSGTRTFVFAPDTSGFMVPPPARDDDVDRMMKSPTFLSGVMRPLSGLFQSPRFLSAMTLGELGNLLEFTIHGWMHLRWTHTLYDPASGDPVGARACSTSTRSGTTRRMTIWATSTPHTSIRRSGVCTAGSTTESTTGPGSTPTG